MLQPLFSVYILYFYKQVNSRSLSQHYWSCPDVSL